MRYIGKKVLTMLFTILMISFLVFLAFAVLPGDPALSKLGTDATPERVEALREEMGLNEPFFVRYGTWLVSLIKGDMGISYSYGMPVKDLILDKLPITITLTIMAFVLIVIVSIPLGIYTAKYQGRLMEKVIYFFNQLIMAVPPFFSGILITLLFGLVLRWFVPGGFVSYEKNFASFMKYMIYPAVAIALPKIAMTVKLLRSSLIKESKKEYVRTAYSKGNNTNGVFYGHILKNAIIPVVTFLGMVLADIVAGSIIIEQVFNIPGIGRILLTSIMNRDYPVVEAIIVCLGVMVVMINFIVDVLYRLIDPRMKRS